ncbi:hypothetical protein J6590_092073 [Homalodisca vitripennis]|nr:hypothetical protein J6590_092073 [Homalodisca vitripennis]
MKHFSLGHRDGARPARYNVSTAILAAFIIRNTQLSPFIGYSEANFYLIDLPLDSMRLYRFSRINDGRHHGGCAVDRRADDVTWADRHALDTAL